MCRLEDLALDENSKGMQALSSSRFSQKGAAASGAFDSLGLSHRTSKCNGLDHALFVKFPYSQECRSQWFWSINVGIRRIED